MHPARHKGRSLTRSSIESRTSANLPCGGYGRGSKGDQQHFYRLHPIKAVTAAFERPQQGA